MEQLSREVKSSGLTKTGENQSGVEDTKLSPAGFLTSQSFIALVKSRHSVIQNPIKPNTAYLN